MRVALVWEGILMSTQGPLTSQIHGLTICCLWSKDLEVHKTGKIVRKWLGFHWDYINGMLDYKHSCLKYNPNKNV